MKNVLTYDMILYRKSERGIQMSRGKIIILNGASSTGKTTLAKALQNVLAPTYVRLSIDDYMKMLPEKKMIRCCWSGWIVRCRSCAAESWRAATGGRVSVKRSSALSCRRMNMTLW